MSRSAPIVPIDGKMYRHFAIATVLITGCLAMFADGENREAMANTIEAQQRQAAVQQAEQEAEKKSGKRKNFTDKRKVKGSFSSDPDLGGEAVRSSRVISGFGDDSGPELIAAADVALVNAPSSASGPPTITGAPPPGMSPAEYDQMVNRKKKKAEPAPSRKYIEQEVAAMMAASDARSRTRED